MFIFTDADKYGISQYLEKICDDINSIGKEILITIQNVQKEKEKESWLLTSSISIGAYLSAWRNKEEPRIVENLSKKLEFLQYNREKTNLLCETGVTQALGILKDEASSEKIIDSINVFLDEVNVFLKELILSVNGQGEFQLSKEIKNIHSSILLHHQEIKFILSRTQKKETYHAQTSEIQQSITSSFIVDPNQSIERKKLTAEFVSMESTAPDDRTHEAIINSNSTLEQFLKQQIRELQEQISLKDAEISQLREQAISLKRVTISQDKEINLGKLEVSRLREQVATLEDKVINHIKEKEVNSFHEEILRKQSIAHDKIMQESEIGIIKARQLFTSLSCMFLYPPKSSHLAVAPEGKITLIDDNEEITSHSTLLLMHSTSNRL